MQQRAEQTPYKGSNTYIKNFPKLKNMTNMREPKVYKILGKIETSEYKGLCKDQIKALLPMNEAYRYLTFLAVQNDSNKHFLHHVSERESQEELSRGSSNLPQGGLIKKSFESEPISSLEEQKINLHQNQLVNSPEQQFRSPEPQRRELKRNFYSAGAKFSGAKVNSPDCHGNLEERGIKIKSEKISKDPFIS